MKTFVLMISRQFPATHKRKGEKTNFPEKILNARNCSHLVWADVNLSLDIEGCKLHTIRDNYELWKKRIDEVNAGKAVLSIRYWTASPYNRLRDGSKQQEFIKLSKGECGIQKLDFLFNKLYFPSFDDSKKASTVDFRNLHLNDALSEEDFEAWFKGYDLSKPKAIIHFTNFRY